jgi:hypothetical protein
MLLQKVDYAYIIAQTPDGPSIGADGGPLRQSGEPVPVSASGMTVQGLKAESSAPVLAHENAARVRGDPQNLRVLQPGQPCARCSENVDSWRKTPQPPEYAPTGSASAWNLTRIARTLQLRDQLLIRLSRLPVLQFRSALPFRKVPIDLFLVAWIEGECAVHLFECHCRIRFNHALGRHAFPE